MIKTAEEQLMQELAENGTDKQRNLFLAFQEERNHQTELFVKLLAILTIQIKIQSQKP